MHTHTQKIQGLLEWVWNLYLNHWLILQMVKIRVTYIKSLMKNEITG